ncbi:MAG TPA: alginate export family protein, partial [Tepidisphaeraceae bacterium]|nr:alginate export family protein [Tepidisphaeraceae bacterium]
VEGGYTFSDLMFTPRPFIGFDIASGSADGTGRFNQLFPTGHLHFGYIDVVGRQNIIDVHPGVTAKLTKQIAFRAEDHFFWRQNTDDGLYNASGALFRADSGDASYIGNEIDLLLNWQLDRHMNVVLGYSHFFAGDFVSDSGPSEDIDFAYASFYYTF